MADSKSDTATSDATNDNISADERKALEKSRENAWQNKLDKGVPLNNLEEAKADADFNYHQREQERKAREEFEARKQGKLTPSQVREKDKS